MKDELFDVFTDKDIADKLKAGDLVKYSPEFYSPYMFDLVYVGQCKVKVYNRRTSDKAIEKEGIAFISREVDGTILYSKKPLDMLHMTKGVIFALPRLPSERDDSGRLLPREIEAIKKFRLEECIAETNDSMRCYTKKDKEYSTYDKMLGRHNL